MMNKIVNNYGSKHSSDDTTGEFSYPELKKYQLRDTVTLKTIKHQKTYLPKENMTKDAITSWTKQKMELIYA
jgi:hypothetical protein